MVLENFCDLFGLCKLMRLLVIFVGQVDSGSVVNEVLNKGNAVVVNGKVKGCSMKGYFIDIDFGLVHKDFY